MIVYRPNLSQSQRDLLLELVKQALSGLSFESPEFDSLYRLHVKLTDCKPYKC